MWDLFRLIFGLIIDLFRSRAALEAEVLVLKQQIIVLRRGNLILGWVCRLFPKARDALAIVRPDTVVRWHRAGFRLQMRLSQREPSMKAVFRGARGVLLMLSLLIVTGAVGDAADTASINEEALRRSVGQMIVVGFYGINNTDPGFHHVMEDLERGLIGGVLFLARNVQSKLDLETMVREVRQCNCSFKPLIAVDEEGGIIERLGERYGLRHTPSPADIGRSSEENARSEYERLAQKLSDIGFNMNLAPVVDLNTNPTNPIIGSLDRSFSRDPIIVSRNAQIFIEEHHKKGILYRDKTFSWTWLIINR